MSYSNILRYLCRADESIAEAKRAVELDPLSPLTNEVLIYAYFGARRYDLAVAQGQSALEIHPEASNLHFVLGWAYAFQEKYSEATEELSKSIELDGTDPSISPDLAYLNGLTGRKAEARNTLRLLLALAKEVPVDSGMIALVYVSLGQHQEALTLLEDAYRKHSSMITMLKVNPCFDSIRQEPRFQALMRAVGLI
jgi:tetratricopeptide (TPR) repeat protein